LETTQKQQKPWTFMQHLVLYGWLSGMQGGTLPTR